MSRCRKARNRLIHFYSRYDTYLTAAWKFGISFSVLLYLALFMGYFPLFSQIPVILIVAACCSFLSGNALILAGAVALEGQLWGYSLEAAVCGGVLLLILLLLYFSFLPKQSYVVILTALALALQVPCVIPVVCGLLLGAGAFGGILMGTVVYYTAYSLCLEPAGTKELGEAMLNQILTGFQRTLLNRDLIFTLVILTAAFFVVYLIRRLPINYSWYAAIGSGIVVYLALSVLGPVLLQEKIDVLQMAGDVLIGLSAALGVRFFFFSLDYGRTEHLQFEDDDYYYYVKAVPKMEMDRKESLTEKESTDDE